MSDLFSENQISTTAEILFEKLTVQPVDQLIDPNAKAREIITKIKWIGTQVKTEYIPELLQFQNHKSVAVRREVLNVLGVIGDKNLVESLKSWQGSEQDRTTLILLNSTIDKLGRETQSLVKERNTLQVSEFLATIKQLIGSQNFVVEGEIAEINLYHQVVYFALKDKVSGDRLDCMAYYTVLERLDFTLNEGLSIRVSGKASLAKNSSKLRLNVSFIQLTGEGEFLRNLKLLQAKLEKEGLFDPNRKRVLSIFPQKIALLVSNGSAAQSDFIKVLGERRTGLEIVVVPIKTQGDSALKILLNALNQVSVDILNPFSELFGAQTVVITRGGGSKDDLVLFNQEQIVRAIFALPVPSVVAIGHEKDWSLAEMVADFRASTPTQAAVAVSQSNQEISVNLSNTFLKISIWMRQKYESYRVFTQKEYLLITKIILGKIQAIETILHTFDHISKSLVGDWSNKTEQIYFKIKYNLNQNFVITEQKFRTLTQDIDLYNPKKVLKRGYALLTDTGSGKVVEKWTDLKVPKIKITLQDGEKVLNVE